MRVALSVGGFFPETYGGGQTYVLRVAQGLVARGHGVTVVTSAAQASTAAQAVRPTTYQGIQVLSVSVPRVGWVDGQVGTGAELVHAFREVLATIGPQVVHLNGHKVALARVCKQLDLPYVVTAHHPGIVCPAGTLLDDRGNICELKAGPDVCVRCCSIQRVGGTVRGQLLASVPDPVSRLAVSWADTSGKVGFVARALTFPLAVRASLKGKAELQQATPLWVAPSRAIANYLVLNGVDRSRIAVVPHGILPFEKTTLQPFSGRPVRFGYFGTLNRPKGIEVLLEAFGALPGEVRAELHIFGVAQNLWEREAFGQWLAGCHRKGDVRLHGRVGPEELSRAYAGVDVLVLPSIYLEVFGLVVLEAFSAGRPVIVTNSGGPEELVREGVDGLIVRRNDPVALAEALMGLASDPARIVRLAEGIRPVRTIEEHLDQLLPIYERAIREAPRSPSLVPGGAEPQATGS